MKHLKIFGLAAVAALALIAIAGVGSASATRLCAENATPCPEAKRWKNGQAFTSSLETGGAVLDAGFYRIECTTSSINGEILNEGGAGAVIIDLETVSFANCGCPVTTLKAGTMSVEHTASTMNGKLTTANLEITFNCMGHCIYGEGALGTLTGGAMGTMDVNGTMNRVAGAAPGCPATINWKGSYTVTSPEALYVSEA
jgi:hypothetical protein